MCYWSLLNLQITFTSVNIYISAAIYTIKLFTRFIPHVLMIVTSTFNGKCTHFKTQYMQLALPQRNRTGNHSFIITLSPKLVKPPIRKTGSTSSICIGCSNNNTAANSRLSAWGFKFHRLPKLMMLSNLCYSIMYMYIKKTMKLIKYKKKRIYPYRTYWSK